MTPVSGLGGSSRHGLRGRGAAALAALLLLTTACGNDWGRSAETVTPGSTPPDDENGANADGGDSGDTATTNPDEHVPVDAPGVTDTEIRVGGVVSVTNPLGGGYSDAFEGAQAYFDMINSEGGIYGRQLVIASERDDNLANNRSEVQGLLTQDNVFAALPMAALLFQGADLLVRENIPTFGWTINEEWTGTPADPRPNMFGQAGSYLGFTDPTPVLPWLAQEIGAHQIGVLAYNVAAQSRDCAQGVENSFDEYGEATDSDVAYVDKSLGYGVADLSAQVSAMKDAGIDLVTTCMDTNGVVTLAREMRKQRLDAVLYLPNGYSRQIVDEYGDLFEGSFVRTDFVQFESDDEPPGLVNYLEWMERAGSEPTENSMVGWLNADLFLTGLRAAGPDFDRQKVIDAINRMTDYTADGLLEGVDWTIRHSQPPADYCQFISEIQDSEFVPVFTEPGKPFVCAAVEGDDVVKEYTD